MSGFLSNLFFRLSPTVLCLALASATLPAQAQTFKDDAGHSITLKQPVRRVISLAPSITELVYEAGAGSKLIGAVEYSDFPPEANKLPHVGSNQKLDIERIVTLKPDLLLVWYHGNAQREIDQLAGLGIPMYWLEPKRIDDIPVALERIGQLLGTQPTANAAASRFRGRLATLREKYRGVQHVKVFYQVWSKPLLTINGMHLISDVLSLCGGRQRVQQGGDAGASAIHRERGRGEPAGHPHGTHGRPCGHLRTTQSGRSGIGALEAFRQHVGRETAPALDDPRRHHQPPRPPHPRWSASRVQCAG